MRARHQKLIMLMEIWSLIFMLSWRTLLEALSWPFKIPQAAPPWWN